MGVAYAGALAHTVVFKPKQVRPSRLQPGDHVFYHVKGGAYQHHGVVRQNGMIQHFSKAHGAALKYYKDGCEQGCQLSSRNVRLSHLDCFLKHKNRKFYLVRYGQKLRTVMTSEVGTASRKKPGSPEEIEARCETALRDDVYEGAYNPVLFNCESVARKWVLGADSHSKQSLRALALAATAVL